MIRFSTLGLENRKYFWLSVASEIAFSESCRWLFAQPCILSSQACIGDLYSAEIQDAPSAKRQSYLSVHLSLGTQSCVLHLPRPLQILILNSGHRSHPPLPRAFSSLSFGLGLETVSRQCGHLGTGLICFLSSSITPPRCPQPSS